MEKHINKGIKKAARIVGSSSALAAALGVSPPAVCQWLHKKRPVPAKRCKQIEKATGGEVSVKELIANWADLWPELKEGQK